MPLLTSLIHTNCRPVGVSENPVFHAVAGGPL